MSRAFLYLSAALASVAVGGICVVVEIGAEQKTTIVRTVEAAGSGDVAYANLDGLMEWFDHGHSAVALRVVPGCLEIAQKPPDAHWNGSQEGRVCRAAIHTASLTMLENSPMRATN